MKTLYILSGFNNYYNRMVKLPGDTREDYPQETYILDATNFVPNDGVNTEHVVGTYDYNGEGDYLIVTEMQQVPIDDKDPPTLVWKEIVVQRWFIIDSVRNRQGQYTLTLRRDLVADYYNIIAQSPMFIEKATVRDDDPAIYNTEGVSTNQIKTNEYTLKDDSQCAWLVGYFSRGYAGGDQIEITYSNPTVDMTLSDGETIQQFIQDRSAYRLKNVQLSFEFYNQDYLNDTFYKYKASLKQEGNAVSNWTFEFQDVNPNPSGFIWGGANATQTLLQSQLNALKNSSYLKTISTCQTYFTTGTIFQPTKAADTIKLSNSIIQTYDGSSKYRVYSFGESNSYSVQVNSDLSSIDNIPAIKTYLTNIMKTVTGGIFNTGIPTFTISWEEEYISLTSRDVAFETFTFTFPSESNRVHLNDAPYDMFCIPYKEGGLKVNLHNTALDEDNKFTTMDSISALTAAQALAEKMSTNLLDLQLLPFCPLQGWSFNSDGEFEKAIALKDGVSNEAVYSPQANFVIFFSTSSQGTINSSQLHLINTETNEELPLPLSMGNKKISNECDMYRLCSPNYNGQFQFSASKLNGITGFNVDYTYLPYSTYININPNFQGLYGKDFDDARGLICQGDFSISYLSVPWENYQVQNKNYANIFARGTTNLELNQKIQREQQIFNAITGTVMGGAAGIVTGAEGKLPGMITGGILGTAASAIGGALDVSRGDILRQEALDYRQDMYNYQLDNIQALPDSVAKVTAYTRNNKIFPILEYYTCTDIEKQAIANKIAYNGMTVGRIGTMAEFINNEWSYGDITDKGYIKGQLIRFEDFGEDFHIVNSISGELYKGVFTK